MAAEPKTNNAAIMYFMSPLFVLLGEARRALMRYRILPSVFFFPGNACNLPWCEVTAATEEASFTSGARTHPHQSAGRSQQPIARGSY